MLPADQAFLLHRTGTAEVSSSSARLPPTAPVHEVDVKRLYLTFARKLATEKLIETAGSVELSSESTVLALCNTANLHAALSLATVEDQAGKSGHSPLMSFAAMTLAQRCAVSAPAMGNGLFCRVKTDSFLYAPYALPCAPAVTSEDTSLSQSDGWWHMLEDLLHCMGRGGGEERSRLYEAAIRALLSFHASDSPEGSLQLQIPRSIMDALSGCPLEAGSVSSIGDPSALVRVLIEFGNLEDACLLSMRMIHASNSQLRTPAGDSPNLCLPYTLFDLLINHCQQHLALSEFSGQDQHARLRKAFEALSSDLEQHFALLVLA